jgi:hypothetical protein
MNLYYYLFYRLSGFLNKKGTNEWGPIGALTLFVGWNIGILYIKVLPITKENFIGNYKTGLIIIVIALFITNSILFLNKKRNQEIMGRFKNESLRSKQRGSFLVILYMVLTIGTIFFV